MNNIYTYQLCDNGGVNTIELPILLNINTQFEHEYGTYVVWQIDKDEGQVHVVCERTLTNRWVTDHIDKHESITLPTPNKD